MFTRVASLVVVGLLAVPALGQTPAKKPDATAELLAKLGAPVDVEFQETRFQELAEYLAKPLGVPVVINYEAFKQCGKQSIGDARVNVPPVKGIRLRAVLNNALAPHSAMFLVRKEHIEIVPIQLAAKQLKVSADDDGVVALAEPVVSVIVKEKPLNEVVADIAEEFDLNVVVAPQAGDSRMAFVSQRLLNVPADKALDTLATAADLRVVRKGNVFLITSRDHAKEMFDEKLDKERQKIEVQKLRDAPATLVGQPTAPPPTVKPEEKK